MVELSYEAIAAAAGFVYLVGRYMGKKAAHSVDMREASRAAEFSEETQERAKRLFRDKE